VLKDHGNCHIRLSFVGYRDFDMEERSFKVLDFTEDIDEFTDIVLKLKGRGGDDEAEDMCCEF
jgi:hypothetical protein